MNSVEDKFWSQLSKKTGLALPTLEEAEDELAAAKPMPLTDELMNTVVAAAGTGKKEGHDATSGKELSTRVDSNETDLPVDKDRPSIFKKFEDILARIGSPLVAVACQAVDELLRFKNSHEDPLFEFFRERVSAPFSKSERQILEEAVHPPGSLAKVVAHYDHRDKVSVAEAYSWIKHPSTRISTLVSAPQWNIFVALVDSEKVIPRKPFRGGLWVRLHENCHIFLLSKSLAERHDRPSALCHELEEMKGSKRVYLSSPSERKEDKYMNEGSDRMAEESAPERESFANRQTRVDGTNKTIVAQWLSRHLTPRDGAGIVIDAGSACLAMWQEIIDQIRVGKYSYMVVFTNSMLVLEHWGRWRTSPGVRETTVELTATKLDWEHLAFYGPEAVDKLKNPDFIATNVYIGTSGLEFDEKTGGIRFGYLGPAAEPQLKELLFQCRASRRIILATPRKIGFAGARAFNVLDTDDLSMDAPIYLVTTSPEKGSRYEEQFRRALDAFQSQAIERAINEKGLEFHWITIDRETGDAPEVLQEIVIPNKTKKGQSKREAHKRPFGKSAGQQ